MATVQQHIESAAGKIESIVADIKEVFASFKAKYEAAVAAAAKPQPVPVEDADTEFAILDNAMNGLGQLASDMRGAATAVGNSNTSSTDIGAVGVGTSATGGGTPAPTSDPTAGNPPATSPSGSQETGPSGDSHGATDSTFPAAQSGQQSSTAAAPTQEVASGGVTPTPGESIDGVLVSD